MEKGILFHIQKYSIHDGPGIRTTVFLKGCPLSCQWCANPESQQQAIQIIYSKETCTHCFSCISVCPHSAIQCNEATITIDPQRCTGCLACIHHCPSASLANEGEAQQVNQVVQVCLQDKDFYEESGGGVTISGGEGMCQPTFLKALVCDLKQHDLHVAIETTGFVARETFQDLACLFDLLLFDIKHHDCERHRQKTGVPNELILENLKWAIAHHLEVLPRIPVIPEFNDTLEDAQAFAKLLVEMGIKKVQLLPFHQFGEKKYERLHIPYLYKDQNILHREDLVEYQQVFLELGLDCFF